MLPKILHQTAPSVNHMTQSEWSLSEECRTLHEQDGWIYKLWTDDDIDRFMRVHFPSLYSYWSKLNPVIKRIDTVRYLWMYAFGGVYLDIDFECLRPLSTFADYYTTNFSSVAYFEKSVTPKWMFSSPFNSFWLWAVRKIVQTPENRTVFNTAGPFAMKRLLAIWLVEKGVLLDSPNNIPFLKRLQLSSSSVRISSSEQLGLQSASLIGTLPSGVLQQEPHCSNLLGLCWKSHCHRFPFIMKKNTFLVHHCFERWDSRTRKIKQRLDKTSEFQHV